MPPHFLLSLMTLGLSESELPLRQRIWMSSRFSPFSGLPFRSHKLVAKSDNIPYKIATGYALVGGRPMAAKKSKRPRKKGSARVAGFAGVFPRSARAKSQAVANIATEILRNPKEPQHVKDVAMWVLGRSNIDGRFVGRSAGQDGRVPDPKPPPKRKK